MAKMNQHGITKALTGMPGRRQPEVALERYPDRFVASTNTDPNQGMDAVRKLDEDVRVHGAQGRALLGHRPDPAGAAERQEDVPDLLEVHRARHPDLRVRRRARPAHPLRAAGSGAARRGVLVLPRAKIVTRHGGEPWSELMVKLLLKWPNLYYSTSAFAPKHYNKDIINFANTRGADKIIYAGYYPMGLDIDRIFAEMPNVPFRDHVWPKFLYENAARVLEGVMGPLAGIRVVELPNIGPVQFAGMLLSDLGAEVLRVDRATDVASGRTVAGGNASPYLRDRPRPAQRRRRPQASRRRRSGAAPLRARRRAARRVPTRRGRAARRRSGAVSGRATPRLVYARMTGWGQSRPARGRRRARHQLPLGRGRAVAPRPGGPRARSADQPARRLRRRRLARRDGHPRRARRTRAVRARARSSTRR